MKKLTIALLAIVMAFAFAACSSNEPAAEQNEIADLFANEEYIAATTGCSEGVWKGVFQKDDYAEVLLVEAKMTDEQAEAYEAIDYASDDVEEQQQAIIFAIEDVTITDITDQIPTQEELDAAWIGKKCGDFEEAGFYDSGNTCDENDPSSLELFYDGPEYCVAVGFGKDFNTALDDLSPNDIRELKITSVRMIGLGDSFID